MNEDLKIEESVEVVEESEKLFFTGYEICKELEKQGVIRKPQMIYNYMKNGLIETQVVGSQNLVSKDEKEKFVKKFVAKHGNKK